MNQRRRGDQGIAFRAWVGNVKMRATLRDGCIDGEDATLEARQNQTVYPCAENCALRGVPARDLKRAQLNLHYASSGRRLPDPAGWSGCPSTGAVGALPEVVLPRRPVGLQAI
jgi:hypothetical protein